MKIVYDSLTGQGAKFSRSLGYETVDVLDFEDCENIEGPLILVTRSLNFGETPIEVQDLMEIHHDKFIGVIATGNRNWGNNFGAGGEKMAVKYNLPLIHRYEGSGFPSDIVFVKDWIQKYIDKQEEDYEE